MWKIFQVEDSKRYVLNLCQNVKGHRYCAVTESGSSAPDMVRQTVEVPPELIRRRAFREIEQLTLRDGDRFVFGPHGEWFTTAEAEALAEDHDLVPWITRVAPTLPPK